MLLWPIKTFSYLLPLRRVSLSNRCHFSCNRVQMRELMICFSKGKRVIISHSIYWSRKKERKKVKWMKENIIHLISSLRLLVLRWTQLKQLFNLHKFHNLTNLSNFLFVFILSIIINVYWLVWILISCTIDCSRKQAVILLFFFLTMKHRQMLI